MNFKRSFEYEKVHCVPDLKLDVGAIKIDIFASEFNPNSRVSIRAEASLKEL